MTSTTNDQALQLRAIRSERCAASNRNACARSSESARQADWTLVISSLYDRLRLSPASRNQPMHRNGAHLFWCPLNAVANCPIRRSLLPAIPLMFSEFPQASKACGGQFGGHQQVDSSENHYESAFYGDFWLPATRSIPLFANVRICLGRPLKTETIRDHSADSVRTNSRTATILLGCDWGPCARG